MLRRWFCFEGKQLPRVSIIDPSRLHEEREEKEAEAAAYDIRILSTRKVLGKSLARLFIQTGDGLFTKLSMSLAAVRKEYEEKG